MGLTVIYVLPNTYPSVFQFTWLYLGISTDHSFGVWGIKFTPISPAPEAKVKGKLPLFTIKTDKSVQFFALFAVNNKFVKAFGNDGLSFPSRNVSGFKLYNSIAMNKHARNTADFHIQYTTNGKRIA